MGASRLRSMPYGAKKRKREKNRQKGVAWVRQSVTFGHRKQRDNNKPTKPTQPNPDMRKICKSTTLQGARITAAKILKLDRVQLSGGDYAVTLPDHGDVGFRCYDEQGFLTTPDSGSVYNVALIVIAGGIRRRNNQVPGDLLATLSV